MPPIRRGGKEFSMGLATSDSEVAEFLEQCKVSGDNAYIAIKGVLERLHNPETRVNARQLLAAVEKYVEKQGPGLDSMSTYHFRIHQLSLTGYEGFRENRQSLTLLELPSIFIPEDWSFTFFEGISRHPDTGFRDRDVVELGCGNGWVSIALAERWSPRKVYGLDINPRAIKVAWINLYLNALSEDGSPVLDQVGKSLLDRVEFHVSDLLAYCREQSLSLDLIVGCIPQILNPDPTAMSKLVTENASEEFLYSLSNYCGLQGFVEDQFGLGLIARAAEEGISIIKPTGRLIFNIGGRPGQAVTERLFSRRGFHINKLWQTRVNQAADTDILALVEIEKNTRHRFEFFMGRVSEEPISARTAWAYLNSGGSISHGLSVYECKLRMPNQVKTISKFLSNGFHETRGALDLSFTDESVAEEKIPFLAHLARALEDLSYFPHESPAGSSRFRNLIVGFMRIYHHIPLTPASVVVLPSRAVAIENLLRVYSPQLALVDALLTRWLPKKWITTLPAQGVNGNSPQSNRTITVVEAPRRSDLVTQLLKNLKPQIVVTSLADFEMRTSTAFEQLLGATASIGARLILDMSDSLELSSLPGTNGILQFLSSHALPLHVTIICGLVKNQVYSDLEVAFVISENQTLLNALAKAGDVTYGRTAISSQFYYGCLLHELLSFQLPERHTSEQRLPKEEEATKFIRISKSSTAALRSVENVDLDQEAPKICMDFDENLLQVPSAVKVSVFEGFARQNISEEEMDPKAEILGFLHTRYGLPLTQTKELFLSDTSTSLFTKLVLACVEDNGTLIFPMGSSGTFVSVTKFLEANFRRLPTKASNSFKATAGELATFLEGVEKPWLYLAGPTVNPTGQIYTNAEINEILDVCKSHGARVILDTSYSGLEYGGQSESWDLKQAVIQESSSTYAIAILGGFSAGLMTGGLEFGFAAVADPIFIEVFKDAPTMSRPHGTLKYTIKKLLGMLDQKSEVLLTGVEQQKKTLKHRAQELCKLLASCGWEAIAPQGGMSMVARPTAYEGKCIKGDAYGKEVLSGSNIRDAILKVTGLSISSSSWTGIPDYCRFMIALSDDDFIASCKALQKFNKLVLGSCQASN